MNKLKTISKKQVETEIVENAEETVANTEDTKEENTEEASQKEGEE